MINFKIRSKKGRSSSDKPVISYCPTVATSQRLDSRQARLLFLFEYEELILKLLADVELHLLGEHLFLLLTF